MPARRTHLSDSSARRATTTVSTSCRRRFPDLYAPFDPTSLEPTNTDLEVRLIHGLSDGTLGASESSEFLAHVLSYGLDAQLISTDSGHGEMIDPMTPAGVFVAEQVVALVMGEPSTRSNSMARARE